MQELELTDELLGEIECIEQLQECVSELETEKTTGHGGGAYIILLLIMKKVSTARKLLGAFFDFKNKFMYNYF